MTKPESDPQPKLHAIRRVSVSDADQQVIDRAIVLYEASRGCDAPSTPEARGEYLTTIVHEWAFGERETIREVSKAKE